jgi:rod shape-determining protein MreD
VKLFSLLLAVGFLTVLFQTTFLHLLPLGGIVPDLVLVICVYLGLNHQTVGSVFGAFLLGYAVDVFSSPVSGLNAFALSFVFLAVYVSSHWVWVRSPLLSSAVVFFASWIKGAALVLLWTLFLARNELEFAGFLRYIFLDSLVAALLAPVVFSFLSRAKTYLEGSRLTL